MYLQRISRSLLILVALGCFDSYNFDYSGDGASDPNLIPSREY
jgi:hypothetical protein